MSSFAKGTEGNVRATCAAIGDADNNVEIDSAIHQIITEFEKDIYSKNDAALLQ